MDTRKITLVLALAGATLLAGCATTSSNASGILTYQVGPERGGDDARAEGVLAFDDGCLRFTDGTIPVFPDDEVSWDGTTLVWRGDEYHVGDEIELGGGEGDREHVETPVPSNCGEGRVWIVSAAVESS